MRVRSTLVKFSLAPVLGFVLWFGACSDQVGVQPISGPNTGAAFFSKSPDKTPGKKPKKGATVQVVSDDGTASDADLGVSDQSGSVSGVVNPDQDATLQLGGYTLFVPAGAVKKPTEFSMTVSDRSLSGDDYTAVELRAVQHGKNKDTDVGAQGFPKNVTLSIDASVNGGTDDLSGASIVWAQNSSAFHTVQCKAANGKNVDGAACVSVNGSVVTANLRHFSDYALGFPRSKQNSQGQNTNP